MTYFGVDTFSNISEYWAAQLYGESRITQSSNALSMGNGS